MVWGGVRMLLVVRVMVGASMVVVNMEVAVELADNPNLFQGVPVHQYQSHLRTLDGDEMDVAC